MKTCKLLFLLTFLFIARIACCDILPENSHFVNKCVKITNIIDYPDISLLGYVTEPAKIPTYIISSDNCLYKGYKFNDFTIFAVKKSYLAGKDITSIEWNKDKNAITNNIKIDPYYGFLHDTIPINAIDQFYRIAGFTDKNVVLYKWKEITKFNNGKPDSVKIYTYPGDSTLLSQKIQTNISTTQYSSSIILYPAPNKKMLNLKINNFYYGLINVKILSLDGRVLKSIRINKLGTKIDSAIQVEELAKGTCLVKVEMGKYIETKRMIIQ